MPKGRPGAPETMKKIVSLCKRRGFVFPSSEIYGGLKSSYDYGPLGTELKRNVREAWWRAMVHTRDDIVGLECSVIMHPRVWEASGHLSGFTDPLVDCRVCRERFRPDEALHVEPGTEIVYRENGRADGRKLKGTAPPCGYVCPNCGSGDLSDERLFNLMFRTSLGPVDPVQQIAGQVDRLATLPPEDRLAAVGEILKPSAVYLRPETAQGMFVNFLNVQQASRLKPPFGIAQIGKSYRNEITPGNLTFRTCEFEQMEMEYFVPPEEDERWFEYWKEARYDWYAGLGISREHMRLREHEADELAHYAKGCVDIEYLFPFETAESEGEWCELEGVANRTDYDLKRHSEFSGKELVYFDNETKRKYMPYVIEPAAGADRAALAFLCEAYDEEALPDGDERTVLRFHPRIAPIKAAVFPLVKRDGMPGKAQAIHRDLLGAGINAIYDQGGAVGRRYRRMDEVGTPWCFTVDGQTLEDGTVTVRDRDTMAQERIRADGVVSYVQERLRA